MACLDDWVSLAEAVSYIRDAQPGASDDELKAGTVALLSALVREGLVVAGELSPRFRPWALSAEATVRKIKKGWHLPASDIDPGHGWWFDLTAAGQKAAETLAEQRRRRREP